LGSESSMNNQRFQSGDVTETLIRATEIASQNESTDALVILYRRPPQTNEYGISYVFSKDLTIADANWLVDKLKVRLLVEPEDVRSE